MTQNYNEKLSAELTVITGKIKRGMLPLVARNPTLENVTLAYTEALDTFYGSKKNPPPAFRNQTLLDRAANCVMYEELKWSHPDKMSIVEYPVLSDSQLDERMEKSSPHSDLQFGDRRYTGRHKVHFTDDDGSPQVRNPRLMERTDLTADRVETQVIVHDALDNAGLTDRQRQVINLVYFENMTQEDAAEEMGIRRQVIMRYHDAGLRKLREYLTEKDEKVDVR